MKELRSILALLVLLVGSFALYKILPAYWENYQVNQMIDERAIYYTTYPQSDDVIAQTISQRAQGFSVPLAPDQVTVFRTPGNLTIGVAYTVHVDFPGYPFDLNFNDTTTNHDVMYR